MTPQDIREKTFEKAMFGGYDMAAVQNYQEEVATELANAQKEVAVLKGKMKVLVDKIEEYRASEDAMRLAILSAQKVGKQIEDDAQARADKILGEAKNTSDRILGGLQHETANEEAKLLNAKTSCAKFLEDVRNLCMNQLEYLDKLSGSKTAAAQPAAQPASVSAAPAEPVSAPVEEEPYDYVPLDAYGAAPVEVVDDLPPIDVPDGMGAVPVADGSGAPAAAAPMVLTDLERKSLAGERELLTMLTSYPDLFRTYADRICSIEWVDPRHESIAWAVLATPPGTDPAACMDAARSVCPEAATLVSAGRISATSKHPTETNIVFMLDTLELYTIKRRMRAAQAKLRQDRSLDDEARRALTMQAMQDSQRQRELQKSIGGVADPFRLIGPEAAGTEQA